ncbi:MAG TPA: EI24 domain-containing protein [Fimbriimonadaceae bacterium]|nr:EI24 domain-containing protein [Fimbriimonadaceae bacterium]
MSYFLDGIALILRTPKLWRFVVQPLLTAAIAFLAVAAGAYWLIVPRLDAWIDARIHAWSGLVALMTSGLYILLLALTSGFLYLTLASFFSASLWEKLSLEVEFVETGKRVEAKLPVSAVVKDSLLRGSFAVGVSLLSLCCGWTFLGIPAILFAGFLGLHDYTSSACLRRGITFPNQMAEVRTLRGRFSFLLAAGLLTLIPLVNVIMLPGLVAGGTLMVVRNQSSSPSSRKS